MKMLEIIEKIFINSSIRFWKFCFRLIDDRSKIVLEKFTHPLHPKPLTKAPALSPKTTDMGQLSSLCESAVHVCSSPASSPWPVCGLITVLACAAVQLCGACRWSVGKLLAKHFDRVLFGFKDLAWRKWMNFFHEQFINIKENGIISSHWYRFPSWGRIN